jgi:tyrosine-protein phosphatase non-receptor type 11
LEAEELLKEELNGTYLVRESTSKGGEYAISVNNEDSVLHVRICYTDGRFRVVPKDSFRTMSDLLDNYIRIPMVQFDGTAVRLRTPLFSTRFTAACVDERIACLQKATAEATGKDGIVEEYENLHKEKDTRLFISCKEGRKPDNVRKNRYKNVVPYDHTRIKLKTDNSSSSDYINANLIEILSEDPKYAEFSGLSMKYISTQGCLQNTTEDFWRMVWQENSRVIVMVTKETERGRVKCCRYWPNLNEEQTFGISSAFLVKNIQEEEFDDYIFRTFVLTKDIPDAAPRKIYHFQFTSWEDNGSPSDSVLAFLEEVNRWSEGLPAVAGPTVVHCRFTAMALPITVDIL